ncbi:MAG: GNAT family N-acetyltransferase [Acidobacteriota bacterium]|nr:GNAT family N-acetyltransferase [Acidobacteriota bacterium]MDH3529304.1 GNAT family N-acetyltransferase [Acidobacteriota bacterium]
MFTTERLTIRPFEDSDLDDVFAMRSDPEIMRFIRDPQNKRSDAQRWMEMISSKWNINGIGFGAVVDRESQRFAGWCGLWKLKETNEIEVGYAVRKEFWGKGYATEAARRMLGYAFDEIELNRVVAVAYPENMASINVMKKLGMACVGRGRFYDQDLVQYAITSEEFHRDKMDRGVGR